MYKRGFCIIGAIAVYAIAKAAMPKSKERLEQHLQKVYEGCDMTPQKKKQQNKVLGYYYLYPIDLNKKEVDALLDLEIASAAQIKALLRYRTYYAFAATIFTKKW